MTEAWGKKRGRIVSAVWRAGVGVAMLALAVAWAGCSSSSGPTPVGPGTGLWVPDHNDIFGITEFQGKVKSGPFPPHRDLLSDDITTFAEGEGPDGIAFDKKGNLFSTNNFGHSPDDCGTITEFKKATLKALKTNSAPEADVIISVDDVDFDLCEPQGLAFDSSGNLWVAVDDGSEDGESLLLEFLPGQLVATGSPEPNIELEPIDEGPIGEFNFLDGVRFDKSGNLWVADKNFPAVDEYTKAQLAALAPGENHVDPNLTIDSDEFDSPGDIAFDGAGNLWVADEDAGDDGEVFEFKKTTFDGLTGLQDLTPDATLDPTAVPSPPATVASDKSIHEPEGLDFLKNGNLVIANAESDECGSLAEFKKKDLVTGTPTPILFVDSDPTCDNLDFPDLIRFGIAVP